MNTLEAYLISSIRMPVETCPRGRDGTLKRIKRSLESELRKFPPRRDEGFWLCQLGKQEPFLGGAAIQAQEPAGG